MGRAWPGGEAWRPERTSSRPDYPAHLGNFQRLWTTQLSPCLPATCLAHKLVDARAGVCVQAVGKNIFDGTARVTGCRFLRTGSDPVAWQRHFNFQRGLVLLFSSFL